MNRLSTRWHVLALAVLAAVFTDAGIASERTLRCQGRLVSIGDTAAEVREKCGEPHRLSFREEDRDTTVARIFDYETERYQAPVRVDKPIRVEVWTYDFGSNRLLRTLHFENDRLIRIESGSKVGN